MGGLLYGRRFICAAPVEGINKGWLEGIEKYAIMLLVGIS